MHVNKINICLSFFFYTYLIFPRVTSDFGKNKNIKNKMMKTNYRLYIYIFKIHVLEIKEIPPFDHRDSTSGRNDICYSNWENCIIS